MPATGIKDIVDTAVDSGAFTKLDAALSAADLIGALRAKGPFTVFAPADSAFATLPAGTIEALFADIPKLTSILMYHVVPGKYLASNVTSKVTLKTLEGRSVTIDPSNGVKVNGTNVITPDIECANGVIHVIDAVLLPA
jgi:uncharacterized surface protein with fasciclin (FAS1) repeats